MQLIYNIQADNL